MAARRQFSREFKLEAVKLVEERGVSLRQAAQDLDVHENVLRIQVRKVGCKVKTAALLVNQQGKRLTGPTLRTHFDKARDAAAEKTPALTKDIKKFRFYDLRAKAADDTADGRGEEAARDLLGHESVKTTQSHYLRRGKIVAPTK
jgi:integrase